MRRPLAQVSCVALLLALPLSGCGSSSASPQPVASISITSPAIHGTSIPALYTCDGKDMTPPVEWGAVPAGTKELALLVVGLTPGTESGSYGVSIEWAVAGINPALHRLEAGRLPSGSFAGLNSANNRRYSICPAHGVSESYQFQLYAVPSRLRIIRAFRGVSILGILSKPNTTVSATGQGAFVASYKRS
jgi:phosphatidylethanolamine-binding protein (PEBP) family uncharacterized protein